MEKNSRKRRRSENNEEEDFGIRIRRQEDLMAPSDSPEDECSVDPILNPETPCEQPPALSDGESCGSYDNPASPAFTVIVPRNSTNSTSAADDGQTPGPSTSANNSSWPSNNKRVKSEPVDNSETENKKDNTNTANSAAPIPGASSSNSPRIKVENNHTAVPIKREPETADHHSHSSNSRHRTKTQTESESPRNKQKPQVREKVVPLVNFFEFASAAPTPTVGRSFVETIENDQKLGAPYPNLPKVAHYSAHDPKSERRYFEEYQSMDQDIIGPGSPDEDADTDEEASDNEEQACDNPWFNPQQMQDVYAQYKFNYRKIDNSKLGVFAQKDKILSSIEQNQVVIIDGYTGCGKTTQVPQFILDQHFQQNKLCNIVITQPRRIAAISVARRVCAERGWTLGSVVGYQVGMDIVKGKDTLITYMTTGVLLQRLITRKKFNDITHIIIDEVHERDLESDLLLLVIKKILLDDVDGAHRNVKIILMSATIRKDKFSKYFICRKKTSGFVEEAPVVEIPSKFGYKVEESFLNDFILNVDLLEKLENGLNHEKATIQEEMYRAAVDCIASLDELERKSSHDPRIRNSKDKDMSHMEKRGSVLVFLPGMEEISRLYRSLKAKNQIETDEMMKQNPSWEGDFYKWEIVPLHSTITNDEQQKVFQRANPEHRKIILSTNIAESSVTVPDVAYVIDFCLTKSLCIDSYTNFTTLRMIWASVSQCTQRKGRTGRVCNGTVFRLVTRQFYKTLEKYPTPEMLRCNLETVILQLKKLKMGTPQELIRQALDPPVVSTIERAVATLKELGALTVMTTDSSGRSRYDTCDGDLTYLGKIMTDLPIPQQCTRLIMLGYCFGVMKEAIIIAASLSVKSPFSSPYQKNLNSYLSKLTWARKTSSDLFALYYLYKHWTKQFGVSDGSNSNRRFYQENQWARGAYVQLSVLREIKSTVELIEERLKNNSRLTYNPAIIDTSEEMSKEACIMLKVAIAGAFYPNFFYYRPGDPKMYEKEKSREVSGLDLLNTVYFKGFPPDHDGKIYAKVVSDYLTFGLNVPSIKFDGSKVLACFNNVGERIGPISKGVYRAVKRRQIMDRLEFPVVRRETEAQILKDWNKKLRERRFTPCPPQIALPSIKDKRVYVRVTYIDSPSQFWINYSQCVSALDEMNAGINHELKHIPITASKIVPNALCLAPYKDRYYRAKILQSVGRPVDQSMVYFVDFGNTEWVNNSVLLDFSPSMLSRNYHRMDCLAIECRLSGIKPATVHGAGWHSKATQEFECLVETSPYVFIEIYSVTKSIIAGKLYGQTAPGVSGISLNESLSKFGYAEFADESSLSKGNNQTRDLVDVMDLKEGEVNAHNLEQIGDQMDFDFIDIQLPKYDCSLAFLKGPWSPLELDFQSVCKSTNTKQVRVDSYSVNSVVLDTEPTAPISRLLIASHIGIQDRSGSVIARDTTMMPSVPGMLALMALMFAPKLELRVDLRQTQYTGALCGLGSSPNDPELSLYVDHDVEIVFDTVINDDDIDRANKIRSAMNVVLSRRRLNNVSSYQTFLKDEIMGFLKKRRPAMSEEFWPPEEYIWNRIDPSSIIPPSRAFLQDAGQVFQPHNKVMLNKDGPSQWSWDFAI